MIEITIPPPLIIRKDFSKNKIIDGSYIHFIDEVAPRAEKVDVIRSLEYIHNNLLEPSLSVRDLITACGIKTNRFYERFASEVTLGCGERMTPRKYIEWLRIRLAKRILKYGDYNLTELAYAIGFISYSSFYRACYRQMGCSPLELSKGEKI